MSYTPRHSKPSRAKRRAASVAALAGLSVSLFAAPAHAQQANPLAQLSSASSAGSLDAFAAQATAAFEQLAAQQDRAARDAAWNTRNTLIQQANGLAAINPELPAQAKAAVDGAVVTFFPGLIAQPTPKPAPAPATQAPARAAQAPAPAAPAFDYGPCPKDAKACIDIDGRRSWLQQNGKMYYQAATIGPGKPGYETPRGTFYVNRKVKDEISYEFNNAPMPYATYFTNNGIAFHEGDPAYLSHGCIRMYRGDAQRYFNDLQIGDKVFIY